MTRSILSRARSCFVLFGALCGLTHCDGEIAETQQDPIDRYVTMEGSTTPDKPDTPITPGEPKPEEKPLQPGEPVVCPGDQLEVSRADVRRLSKNEYINTLAQHFPAESIATVDKRLGAIQSDAVTLKSSPGQFDPFFGRPGERDKIEQRLDIARLLAQDIATNPARLAQIAPDCMSDLAATDQACVDRFVSELGHKLLRRPLEQEDVDAFAAAWTQGDEALDSPERRVEVIITALLTDPEFLFHIPKTSASSQADLDQLSQQTIASRLSYAVSGQAPDQALMDAAEAGELDDPDVRRAHAERLLDSEAGRTHVVQIFDHWLGLEREVDLELSGTPMGVDINGLYDEMRQEAHAFIRHIIFEERGSYHDLMTSPMDFPPSELLANLMGHDNASPSGIQSTTGRAGLLSRPAMLVHKEPRVPTIHRGVHIMFRFLCKDLTVPDNADDVAVAKLAELGERVNMMSSRELAAHQTSPIECAGCHDVINPLGYALSAFGPLGNSWEEEHIYNRDGDLLSTVPLDTSAMLAVDGTTLMIDGAADYGAAMADSDEGRACISTQLFRVTHMREPTQLDACHFKRIRDGIDAKTSIFDILVDNAAREAVLVPTKETTP